MLQKIFHRDSLLGYLGLVLVFYLLIFPAIERKLAALSGGYGMLDAIIFYTPQKAFEVIAAYGEEGRSLYVTASLSADLVFPLVYSSLLAGLIYRSVSGAFVSRRWMQSLIYLPFVGGVFDLFENGSIITLARAYPAQPHTLASFASLISVLKWVALIAAVLTALICWAAASIKKRQPPA